MNCTTSSYYTVGNSNTGKFGSPLSISIAFCSQCTQVPRSGNFIANFPSFFGNSIAKRKSRNMSSAEEKNPIYGPFFGVMGAASAIIFSCE